MAKVSHPGRSLGLRIANAGLEPLLLRAEANAVPPQVNDFLSRKEAIISGWKQLDLIFIRFSARPTAKRKAKEYRLRKLRAEV
jgi:hypothetical protein